MGRTIKTTLLQDDKIKDVCKHVLELQTSRGSDLRLAPVVQPWALATNSKRAPSDWYALERLYDCRSLIQTQTHTPPSLFSLHLMIILATTEGGRGGEREREETKRGREGERGLVFTRLTHPISLSTPLYSFLLSPTVQIILTCSLYENEQENAQRWYSPLLGRRCHLSFPRHFWDGADYNRKQLPWLFLQWSWL